MRKFIWGLVVLIIAAIAYCGWAFFGVVQLATAAQQGDTAALMQRIDLHALRRSLARQIVGAYMRQNPKLQKMRGMGASLAGSLGTSVADAMLEDVLTPDNITKMLKDGRFGSEKLHAGASMQLPKFDSIQSNGLSTILGSYFDGLASFVVPVARTGETYAVHFILTELTWKLSGIDLPSSMLDRLGKEVGERQTQ